MVICKRCQSENQDQTRFCTFCGGRLPARVEPLAFGSAPTKPQAPEPASRTHAAPARSSSPRPDPEAQARYVQKTVYQHFIKAKELIRERKFDAALREFERALEVSPAEPTITEMMAKTLSAKKAAEVAHGERPRPVEFKPAGVPLRSSPPVTASAVAEKARSPIRKLVTDPWFRALTGTPSVSPSMVLDLPTSERITEVAVTGFILAGLGFFVWLLTI